MKSKIDIKNMNSLPTYIDKCFKLINDYGGDVYIVGGCMRDILLSKEPSDYDLTTNLTPEQIKEVFKDYSLINNNGEKHGTITIRIDNTNVEITTFRCDGNYLNHRSPEEVIFTTNLIDDLSRRDFTINAIASDLTYTYDYFNGLQDLKDKIIKCVGNPEERFNEDALRILRAMRFASQLDFNIDMSTLLAMKKYKKYLCYISKERIKSELDKMVVGKGFMRVALQCSDILETIIPELSSIIHFDHMSSYHYLDVFEHSIAAVHYAKSSDHIVKLALLLHDIGKAKCYTYKFDESNIRRRSYIGHPEVSYDISKDILSRLTYSNKEKEYILFLIKYHDYVFTDSKKCIKKFLNKIPKSLDVELTFNRLLLVKEADRLAHTDPDSIPSVPISKLRELYEKIKEDNEVFSLKDLQINGYDLLELGYSGITVGKILNDCFTLVLNENLENNKSTLLAYIKDNYSV